MWKLSRRDFADCAIVCGRNDAVYAVKSRPGQSLLCELEGKTHRSRTIAVLPASCVYPALAFLNNTVHILGGTNADESRVFATCWEVNTLSGSVGRLPDLTYARARGAAVWYKQSLYVIGGYEEVQVDGTAKYRVSSTLERLAAGNWVLVGLTLPVPLSRPSPFVVCERLFLVGGITRSSQASLSVYELKPAQGTTVAVAALTWALEEGMPVDVAVQGRDILLRGKVHAVDNKIGEARVRFAPWEVRRPLLCARLKLHCLALV